MIVKILISFEPASIRLTDMSVFELSALPKLRRIGLVRVNQLTDEAIYALAERHATLERIHLSLSWPYISSSLNCTS